ncbi:MAG: hypothetical protein AAF986_09420 [Pseudomonadota bacterium]
MDAKQAARRGNAAFTEMITKEGLRDYQTALRIVRKNLKTLIADHDIREFVDMVFEYEQQSSQYIVTKG